MRQLHPYWLGRRRYDPIHTLQQTIQQERIDQRCGDVVLFVEHTPVVTLGRGAHPENFRVSRDQMAEFGVDVVETGRGGDLTFHGPGQLVMYPIIDLNPDRCDVRKYVRDLAQTMIRLAADFGVSAGLIEEHIGIWVDAETPSAWPGEHEVHRPVKLGAIGVRLSRWGTMHGFAFNLTTDLELFSRLIVPCGIASKGITSIKSLLGEEPDIESVVPNALRHFSDVLGATARPLIDASGVEDDMLARLVVQNQ